ncbi:hypothetical protein [Azospirillum argentinense]
MVPILRHRQDRAARGRQSRRCPVGRWARRRAQSAVGRSGGCRGRGCRPCRRDGDRYHRCRRSRHSGGPVPTNRP